MPHTPGPWTIDGSHSWNIGGMRGGQKTLIASAHFGGYQPNAAERMEVDSNARLIAAAPDLLDALYAVKRILEQQMPYDSATLQMIRLSLVKATGGYPMPYQARATKAAGEE